MKIKQILLTTTAISALYACAGFADVKISNGASGNYIKEEPVKASPAKKHVKKSHVAKKEALDTGIHFNKGAMDIAVGGSLDAQAGYRIQDKKFIPPVSANNKNLGLDTTAAVHLSVSYKASNNWLYGGQIGLGTTTISDSPGGKSYLDRTYIYAENQDYGRFEVGSNDSAGSRLKITGASVAAATGGIDGAWDKFISVKVFPSKDFNDKYVEKLFSRNFISGPGLVVDDNGLDPKSHEKIRKISYYTPKYNGIQAGITYMPDSWNKGGRAALPFSDGEEKDIRSRYKDIINGGIKWSNQVDQDQLVELSVVGEHATRNKLSFEKGKRFHQVNSVVVGGLYKYQNIAASLSYSNRFKSGLEKIPGIKGLSDVYAAGVAYQVDKVATSLTYMFSERNKNKLHLVSVGAEYNLAPGILPYAEATYMHSKLKRDYANSYDSSDVATITHKKQKNSGTALILGTKVTF